MVSRVFGPVLTVVCGAAFVALIGFLLHQQPAPALAAAPQGGSDPHHAFLHISTYPDSMAGEHGKDGGSEPDWVSYGPTTTLYGPAQLSGHGDDQPVRRRRGDHQPWFAKVHGTVGGTETVNGKTVTEVDPTAVGHTFTIHAAPTAQDPLFVSAPLPAVPDDAPVAPGSDVPEADRGHVHVPDQGTREVRVELRVPVRRRHVRQVRRTDVQTRVDVGNVDGHMTGPAPHPLTTGLREG